MTQRSPSILLEVPDLLESNSRRRLSLNFPQSSHPKRLRNSSISFASEEFHLLPLSKQPTGNWSFLRVSGIELDDISDELEIRDSPEADLTESYQWCCAVFFIVLFFIALIIVFTAVLKPDLVSLFLRKCEHHCYHSYVLIM